MFPTALQQQITRALAQNGHADINTLVNDWRRTPVRNGRGRSWGQISADLYVRTRATTLFPDGKRLSVQTLIDWYPHLRGTPAEINGLVEV
jgi:hypothetical protein